MQKIRLKKSNANPNLYICYHKNLYTFLILYVDDLIITKNNTKEILEVEKRLQLDFKITSKRKIQNYLGIEFKHPKHRITLH